MTRSQAQTTVERAVVYSVTRNVFKTHPVTGGEATVSGAIQLQLKVTGDSDDSAGVVAALVAVVAVGVVLLPVAEWAAGSELG